MQGKVTPAPNPSLDVKPKPQHVNTSQGDRMTGSETKPKRKSKLKKVVKK